MKEAVNERVAYFNGQYGPESKAQVSIFDLGFRIGDGVYDVARTYGGKPFKLRAHVDRLYRSMTYARLTVDLTPDEFEAVCQEVLDRNRPLLGPKEDYSLWMNVTRGIGATGHGASPPAGSTVAVYCILANLKPFAKAFTEGIRLVTPSVRRFPPECLDPKAKISNKMNHILADRESRVVDAESYSLMLDVNGFVAENSAANFFFAGKGELFTPTTRNVLAGVTRETIFELAAKLGIRAHEGDYTVYDALMGEEAFLTGTTPTILPARSLNGVEFPSDIPGPVTDRLLNAWSDMVGIDVVEQAQSHLHL
ncbi:MAG: aminotransferase class IV [Nitrospinota bacterium]